VSFVACRVFEPGGASPAQVVPMETADLSPGDVLVRVQWSSLNFKDALAVTGRAPILRRTPLNPGIDAAGVVVSSGDSRVAAGETVLLNGMGLGETQDGGLAQYLRVPAEWVMAMPSGLDARGAMALGTAGFTAALALERLERLGQTPATGPLIVTGASGGVGSVAVRLAAARGYEVIAVSGRPQHGDYLKDLGARHVTSPEALGLGTRPLESARYGGAIDNVGGGLLSDLTRHVAPWGSIACVGNAGGADLRTSVLPLILRGVSLVGVSSSRCPMPLRTAVWRRIAAERQFPPAELLVERVVSLAEVPEAALALLERRVRGRILVNCQD